MTAWLATFATVSCSAAALLFYLASPQQQWRAIGPLRGGAWLAALFALASLCAAMRVLAPMEAVFAWSVLLMFVWSVAPFLGAWRARVRAGKAA